MPMSTFKLSGILPPGTGSTRTKNVPVPISGWVHREMTQPAIRRFSMIGNGGPLCALAGNANSNASAAVAKSRAIEMGRFGMLTTHQRGAHFHGLEDEPQ